MTKLKIYFSQGELKVLNDALVQLPFAVVAPVIHSINSQIESQLRSSDADKNEGCKTSVNYDENGVEINAASSPVEPAPRS